MSLFGSSPAESPLTNPPTNSKTLFGGEPAQTATSASSLFADDSANASPWNIPATKKTARKELIKILLPGTDVPESYIDAFDAVLDARHPSGAGVPLTSIKGILGTSGLNASDQAQIFNLILPDGEEAFTELGRAEFNVLLALIGLGQEGEEITLDSVDERRQRT